MNGLLKIKVPVYLLVLAIEFALIFLFITPRFENNDDFGMNLISSGAYTGEPSEFLIFINIIIGYFLKYLYIYLPSINWYGIFMLSLISLSYFFTIRVLYQNTGISILRSVLHLMLFVCLVSLISDLQFTKVAAFSIGLGLFVLFKNTSSRIYTSLIAMMFVVLGALVRIEIFYFYLLFSLPLLIYKRLYLNKKVFFYLGATLLVLCAVLFENKQYSSVGFDKIKVFNKQRSFITKEDNSAFYNIKWDKYALTNTEKILATNFLADILYPPFSKELINQIYSDTPKVVFSISDFVITLLTLVKTMHTHSTVWLVFFVISLVLIASNFPSLLVYILLSIGVLLTFSYLHASGTNVFKPRVYWSISFFVFWFFLFLSSSDHTTYSRYNFSFLLVPIALFYLYSKKDKVSLDYLAAIEQDISNVVIPVFSNERFKALSFPQINHNILFLGWFAGTPVNKYKYDKFSILNGVYNFHDSYNKVTWYFLNDYRMRVLNLNNVMLDYYHFRNKNLNVEMKVLPLNNKDTLYRYDISYY